MIKNFKWLLLVSLSFAACTNNDDPTVVSNSSDGMPLTKGTADFSKYVALGNSLCAGYSDNALFKSGQEGSYTNILSKQFALVGGGAFTIPYMNDNIGGLLLGGTVIAGPRLYFDVPTSTPTPVAGMPTTDIINHLTGPFNNMGVPGAKSYHLLAPGYGSVAGVPLGTANPYFARFASTPSATILGDAMAQNPTFFSLWIGNNDVLGYATTGGDGTNPITPEIGPAGVGFNGTYKYLLNTLTSQGAKGVVANIPYVTTVPFFTTVPFNPITAKVIGGGNEATGQATIAALNAQLYGPLDQALTAFGQPDRINILSTTGPNPLLIKDESITDLSAQLTAAFTPIMGPTTAAIYGQIFGQARQSTAADLILLTTQSVIGTAPVGSSYPLNSYGVTYPLGDKDVLIPTEIAELKTATDAFNLIIKNDAALHGLAFVDANKFLSDANSGGVIGDNYTLTSTYVTGGLFSLDGVHPSPRGYAYIANKFLEAINATYGSNLKGVNLANYGILYPQLLP